MVFLVFYFSEAKPPWAAGLLLAAGCVLTVLREEKGGALAY